MKFLIASLVGLCAFAACIAIEEEVKAKILKLREGCVAESGADGAKINELIKSQKWETDDQKLNCYSKCILQTLQNIDADANVNVDKMKENIRKMKGLPDDQVDTVVDKCKDAGKDGKDLCEKAGKLSKCFLESGLKVDVGN